jgi:Leucine-rich repeat (LRR) protein
MKKAYMHTLEELRSGRLKGIKRLCIRENLSSFPLEILDLADTLEILDLSDNRLSSLPPEISRLSKLKIAFFANNRFTHVPSVFKACDNLYMLGFKANRIEVFDEDVLPLSISWLILTDNKIKVLPRSMGKLAKLQKCALAGNKIEKIPDSMAACTKLELLRLSANELEEIPSWLLELPRLSWLAFSGNPCAEQCTDLDSKGLQGPSSQGTVG